MGNALACLRNGPIWPISRDWHDGRKNTRCVEGGLLVVGCGGGVWGWGVWVRVCWCAGVLVCWCGGVGWHPLGMPSRPSVPTTGGGGNKKKKDREGKKRITFQKIWKSNSAIPKLVVGIEPTTLRLNQQPHATTTVEGRGGRPCIGTSSAHHRHIGTSVQTENLIGEREGEGGEVVRG